MDEAEEPTSLKIRLRRERDGVAGAWQTYWVKRWFRWLVYAIGLFLIAYALLWIFVIRDLPSVERLKTYEPPLPTYVRSFDGTPVHSYARERRVQLQFNEYPKPLIGAFLSAEDKTFFEHGGFDIMGILGALWTNLTNSEKNVGASTITQQVAKNLFLTREQTYGRKLKELILARRIESVLTKQQILEIYLNQIELGRRSFGVQAAARAYYDKDVNQLQLHEFAYLAILPKAPANYRPEKFYDRAVARRNWVLGQMRDNGYIDEAQKAAAVAQPLGTIERTAPVTDQASGYFMEEVRRQLIEKFGESSNGGRNLYSVYEGGLWVRSSLDPVVQAPLEKALRDGLMRYDRGRGWGGPIASLQADDDWQARLQAANLGAGYDDWQVAMVLSKAGTAATIGFADGKTGSLPSWAAASAQRKTGIAAFNVLKPGDVIIVKAEGPNWVLKSVPEVSGGMVAQDPHTGRVLAMQGGFEARLQTYNRATQAWRQPGSSFKPFVYAAAINGGMTPASIIVDGPFCVYQSAKLGRKCFKNFGGSGGAGPQTMRWGLEQSRNLMTVRAASQSGMDKVVALADSAGINKPGEKYPAVLAVALGAGETTVMKMVNAYSILARNGRDVQPTLIDFVQDRRGKVLYRADQRVCEGCNMPVWDGKGMPRPPVRNKQAIDAVTSFQVVNMLEGVIKRGTATELQKLERPIFGKTGTTTGPTNVWFVGGSADLIAGVYLGFDQPRPMGGWAQGGTLAVPIFHDFAKVAMEKMPVMPFRAPNGTHMVRIERGSGKRTYGGWPGTDPKSSVIWEAFKAESEPRRTIHRDELIVVKQKVEKKQATVKTERRQSSGETSQPRDSDFLQREGGIY
jgi:penicillin-binding protein 1A